MTFPKELDLAFETAANLIKSNHRGVVFTGAGMSVPSGIPDFRSASTGLWNRFDPMAVASMSVFLENPSAFFDWLQPLVDKARQSKPNAAHTSLAKMQNAGFLQNIITQNIDGLHQKAGSNQVIELHGSLDTLRCLDCGRQFAMTEFIEPWFERHVFPVCPQCKVLLKPNIILFEEMLPPDAWEKAEEYCEKADSILVAGTSLEVMPASELPYRGVLRGANLIIMNLTPTPLDSMARVLLPVDVAVGLPEICRRVLA